MNPKSLVDLGVGSMGLATNIAVAVSLEQVSQIVTIVTSVLIALTTCGIQIYRMIRDRDEDKHQDKDKDKEK